MRSMTRVSTYALDVALLRGREVVIEEDNVGGGRSRGAGNLFQLAFADQGSGIGAVAMLHEFARDLGPGAGSERAQLVERLLGAEVG